MKPKIKRPLPAELLTFGVLPKKVSKVRTDTCSNLQETQFYYTNNAGDNRISDIKNVFGMEFGFITSPMGPDFGNTYFTSFGYAYNSLGRVTQLNSANTPGDLRFATDNYSYDAEGQLLEDQMLLPGSVASTNYDYAFAYDSMGNRVNQQLQVGPPQNESFPGAGGSTVTAPVTTVQASLATYNSVNQLTARNGSGTVPVRISGSVNEPAAVTVNGQSAQEVLDPASGTGGDLFSIWTGLPQGGSTVQIQATDNGSAGPTVTTKHANIFVAGGYGADKNYTYDNNGNCTGYTSASGNVTYGWDAADRLVSVTKGNYNSAFTYDGLGRCVQIVETTVGPMPRFVSSGTVQPTRRFVWSGATRCEERDANNAVAKRFFPEGEQIAGNNYYFTFDRLGSVEQMFDAAGNVRAWYNYDAFGNQTNLAGNMAADFGFAGYYIDNTSGLYLTLYRAYDPDAGRWLNQDPIQERGGINLYGFVGNNPVNWLDPLGLEPGYGNPVSGPNGPVGPSAPTGTSFPVPQAPPPANIPGGPWTWSPNPQNSRGGDFIGAKTPNGQRMRCTPAPSGPNNPNPYWKTTNPSLPSAGGANQQRYNMAGEPITAEEAHPGPTPTPPSTAPATRAPTTEPIEMKDPLMEDPFIEIP
jgi:RHS repeat-associated protein